MGIPDGVAVDSAGNLYIADFDNQRVLKLTGVVTCGGTGGGGIYNTGTMTLNNNTVSRNIHGGIENNRGGTMTLNNSIVSNPVSGFTVDPSQGNVTDGTFLSPPRNYGGPTETMLPLPGSAAICAGQLSLVPVGITADQRGQPRTTTYGSTSCVDAEAVQTHYALTFAQQPTDVAVNTAMSPAPAVQLSEGGAPFTATSAAIGLTLSGPGNLSNGSASTSTSNGIATYTGLSVDTAATGDTLTATLQLGGTYAISSPASSPFAVYGTAVTASVTAANKVYDGTAAATITGCSLTGVLAADVGKVSCGVASASFADVNVGNGKTVTASSITLTGSAAGRYTLSSTSATTTANITPVTLTVTVNSTAITAGAAIPALTYTITGFIAADNSSVVSGTATLTITLPAGSPAGSYPITFSTTNLTAPNYYSFTYVEGLLDIIGTAQLSAPLLLELVPGSATSGGAGFTLTVDGANFAANSVVLWNGAVRATTFVSSTQLTAAMLAQDIANESTSLVTVANPAPNASTLPAQPFAVVSAYSGGRDQWQHHRGRGRRQWQSRIDSDGVGSWSPARRSHGMARA